jgi:hypothetical protein
LGLPPLNLFDAEVGDLSDCFTDTPDYGGYRVRREDARLFDRAAARQPLDPRPSVKMDDPAEVVRQGRGRDAATRGRGDAAIRVGGFCAFLCAFGLFCALTLARCKMCRTKPNWDLNRLMHCRYIS